ncbi:MAG: LpqB family beta-propeller domain-containing protein [Leucobacter sp.]
MKTRIPKLARRQRPAALAAALLAASLIAGCASIPTTGPVEVGLTDLQQAEQFVQYNPARPVSGASQEDLVRGFLQAGASSADDYAVAREFLTTEYAGQWDPYYGVLIDGGSRPYRAAGENSGVLLLSATAKVDAEGSMLPVQPGPNTELRFEFERVGEEWRISSAPAGIILDSAIFSTIWSPHQLYFIGPGDYLVPDTRWFLTRAALPTEIVGALLEGPVESMRDVVRSGFPSGAALASKSVPVTDGQAVIDLNGAALDADPRTLAEMNEQVKMSLQSVTGISGFELRAEGVALATLPDSAEALRTVSEITTPAVLSDGKFGTFAVGVFTETPELGPLIADLDPTAITLAPDGSAAAVLNDGGVEKVTPEGVAIIDDRRGLLAPTYDLFGNIWTFRGSKADEAQVTLADGTAQAISVTWLADRRPVAVRVSPDGSRIAALVRDAAQSFVLVGGVIRDEQGVPTAVTQEAEVQAWIEGRAVDLDWVGQSRFAVLSRTEGTTRVTVGGPGMFTSEQGSVPGGASITGGGSRAQLRVLGDGSNLFTPQGSGWQRVEGEVSVLAKRG